MKADVSTTMDGGINGFLHLTAENSEDKRKLMMLRHLDLAASGFPANNEGLTIDLADLLSPKGKEVESHDPERG